MQPLLGAGAQNSSKFSTITMKTWKLIPGVKKGYTLKRCLFLILSKKSRLTNVPKPVLAEIWVIFVLSLKQILCVVPGHVNRSFNYSSHRRCVLFEKFFLNLLTGILWCCNTCKSLPGSEYATKVFSVLALSASEPDLDQLRTGYGGSVNWPV
jgi:hypothetical protein